MRTKIIISLIAILLLPPQAEAKLTKHWVLKMGLNGGGNYRAFTSPEACDAALRQWISGMKKMQAKFKNIKGMRLEASGKCMDHLPYGYEIVR
jgi:hypothetical protein